MSVHFILVELLEISATAIEVALGIYFVSAFDIKNRNGLLSIQLKIVVIIIGYTASIIIMNNLLFIVAFETFIIAIFLFSLAIYWLFNCRYFSFITISALVCSFVYWLIFFIFDTLATLVFLNLNSITSFSAISIKGSTIRIIYIISMKIVQITLFILGRYLLKKYHNQIQGYKFNRLIIFMLVCFAYTSYLTETIYLSTDELTRDSFWGYMGILLLYFMTIVFYLSNARKTKEAEVLRQISSKNEISNNYTQELSSVITEVQKVHHDAKNHIRTIELLMVNEPKAAELHLEKLKSQLKQTDFLVQTGSSTLDAILFSKMRVAAHQSIEFSLSIEQSDSIGRIDDFNLTIIASNLLDNAITAASSSSSEEKKPVIELTISVRQNALLFRVSNPASPDALERCNNSISSKQGINHGIGILSVKDAVEKQYNGSLDYAYDGGRIIATVTMFIPMKNENELLLN